MNSILNLIEQHNKDGVINGLSKYELLTMFGKLLKKRTSKKKRKHPKRPTSVYMFWLKDNRPKIREKYFSDFDEYPKESWSIEFKQKYYMDKGLSEPKDGWVEGKPKVALVTKNGDIGNT